MTLEFSEEENHVSISEMHNKFGKSAPKLMTFIVYFIGVCSSNVESNNKILNLEL